MRFWPWDTWYSSWFLSLIPAQHMLDDERHVVCLDIRVALPSFWSHIHPLTSHDQNSATCYGGKSGRWHITVASPFPPRSVAWLSFSRNPGNNREGTQPWTKHDFVDKTSLCTAACGLKLQTWLKGGVPLISQNTVYPEYGKHCGTKKMSQWLLIFINRSSYRGCP